MLDSINWLILKFTDFFFCQLKSTLSSSSELFSQITILFDSRISIQYLSKFSVSFWYFLFGEIFSSSSLDMVSFIFEQIYNSWFKFFVW